MMAIPHLEQRSPEWFQARQGRPTASDAKYIVTPKRGELSASRFEYIDALIAELFIEPGRLDDESELFTGRKFFGNRFTDHGNQFEPEAIEDFSTRYGLEVKEVGFVIASDGLFGLSPDGASDNAETINATGSLDWGLETKCKCLKNHIATIRTGKVPDEHLGKSISRYSKPGPTSGSTIRISPA